MSAPFRAGAAFWVQRTGWPELRDAVLRAEAAGFDDCWIDDHLLNDEGDPAAPKLEGWTTLAALAAITRRPRLGLLVAANTFRNPGLTAKLAVTLDAISGGRAILGLGAGWFEREHDAFGIPFAGSVGERLEWLAEAAPAIRRLLDGETVTHDGRHVRLHDAVCAPRPVQPRLPILVGGSGPRRTLPLVARVADLWNAYGSPAELAAADDRLRAACADAGRDEDEIERTCTLNVVIRATRSEAERAWRGWAAAHPPQRGEADLAAAGPVEAVADVLRAYRAAGFHHPVLVFRTPFDLATIERLPELRAALAG